MTLPDFKVVDVVTQDEFDPSGSKLLADIIPPGIWVGVVQ